MKRDEMVPVNGKRLAAALAKAGISYREAGRRMGNPALGMTLSYLTRDPPMQAKLQLSIVRALAAMIQSELSNPKPEIVLPKKITPEWLCGCDG